MIESSLARRHLGWLVALPLAVLFLSIFAGVAFAADDVPSPQPGLGLPSIQFWSLAIGSLVPLVTYMINHRAPWLHDPAKSVFMVAAAAASGALYQLLDAGSLAFDTETLQVVGTAVVGAVFAHTQFYSRSGISAKLGAGSNIQDNPAR